MLRKLLVPQSPTEMQRSAVNAIGRIGDDRVPPALLENWSAHSPELRATIVDVLLRSEAWAGKLLDAIEAKQVAAADLDLPRRQRLMNYPVKAVKERAAKRVDCFPAVSRIAVGELVGVVQPVIEAQRVLALSARMYSPVSPAGPTQVQRAVRGLRQRYFRRVPALSCSFPFGVWAGGTGARDTVPYHGASLQCKAIGRR